MTVSDIKKMLENTDDKLKVLYDDHNLEGLHDLQIFEIIGDLDDDCKMQILHNVSFIKKHNLDAYNTALLVLILKTLKDTNKEKILSESQLISDELHIEDSQICTLIKSLSSDIAKINLIDKYKFTERSIFEIIGTLSNENKLLMLQKYDNLKTSQKKDILALFDNKSLINLIFNGNKEILQNNHIFPYEIIMNLDIDRQKDFISHIEELDLSPNEKKEIFAILKEDVKSSIDSEKLPQEYKSTLDMHFDMYSDVNSDGNVKINNFVSLVIDYDKNLEDYQGLDRLIKVRPPEYKDGQTNKFKQLCSICPNLNVINIIGGSMYFSTGSEYLEAEQWISSLLDNLNPEYSDAQKIAIIDNAIGKKISYSPDFDTELFDQQNCRALWKIISSGYGVCNGVSSVEKYLLNRIGIEAEIVASETHAFLKLKDIEIPLANGEIVKGTTILDPTWNLARHRFDGRPENFFISYEEARKHDIAPDGNDYLCHQNDDKLQDATFNLDDKSLRCLFKSVGLTNENDSFLISDLIYKARQIDKLCENNPEQNIKNQFLLLSKKCPEFATCQDSTMLILQSILLNPASLNFKKCVVNRVYDRKDKNKSPVMYVYIASDELGKRFYFADKTQAQFVELSTEEFISRFECYDFDLEKNNGIRPWETNEQEKVDINLAQSSGRVVVTEGEER